MINAREGESRNLMRDRRRKINSLLLSHYALQYLRIARQPSTTRGFLDLDGLSTRMNFNFDISSERKKKQKYRDTDIDNHLQVKWKLLKREKTIIINRYYD